VKRSAAVLAVSTLLAAPSANAGDGRLELGFGAEMNYEDNVLSLPEDEVDDFYLRVGPDIKAWDRRGDLQWNLDYMPRYLKYVELGELDDWEQYAFGQLNWVPSERTRLFASAQYIDTPSILRTTAIDPTLGDVGVELGRQGVERTVFVTGAEYRLTRRQAATVTLQRYENDYEIESREDVSILDGRLEWIYDLGMRDRAGLELRYSRQSFAAPGQDETRTDYYNASIVWMHSFDPTFYFNVTAGPALVEPEGVDRGFTASGRRFPIVQGANGPTGPVFAATCPTLDDGTPFLSGACLVGSLVGVPEDQVTLGVIGDDPEGTGADVTYFASVSLTKQWKYVRGDIGYVRDTSTAGEFGGSTVRDLIRAQLHWQVTKRFTADFEVSYQRYEAAAKSSSFVVALRPSVDPATFGLGEAIGFRSIVIDNEREDQTYSARVRLGYEFTPQTICHFTVIWQRQQTEIPPALQFNTDRLFVIVGFTYKFRSIPLGI
jgi:hypothetical protein